MNLLVSELGLAEKGKHGGGDGLVSNQHSGRRNEKIKFIAQGF
jgi:hypothetical protein